MLVGCADQTPDKPSPEASANAANRKQREQAEYMQRRAEYDRQHQPGLRQAQPYQPPPPDPATTRPYVPPAMDIKGTPAALAAPDVQASIEKIYEDSDYAYLTRNLEGAIKLYSDKVTWDGEVLDKAALRKIFQAEFEDINKLEAEVGQSLRSGSKNEILKVTPKGPGKVAVHVRCTERLMATAVNFQDVDITETRELWVQEKGDWRLKEITTLKSEHHTYKNGQEITEK